MPLTGWPKQKAGEYLGFGRHYLFRPGSNRVGPNSSYVQGCVEMGDENTRFLIQQQQLGLVVSREWWTSNLHFSKKTFGKIRLRWIRKKPIKSQHPWSRSWIFILGWYSPVGLRYHKLHLVWLGSCCETGGSRCKRKCWRSLSWLWWVEAVPQPLFWLHPLVVLLLVVVVGRYLDWTTNPYFGAVSWISRNDLRWQTAFLVFPNERWGTLKNRQNMLSRYIYI